jgi:hypothetical protein
MISLVSKCASNGSACTAPLWFDYWFCQNCEANIDKGPQCLNCDMIVCASCVDALSYPVCKFCDSLECNACNPEFDPGGFFTEICDVCHEMACDACLGVEYAYDTCASCEGVFCLDCKDVFACSNCGDSFCESCKSVSICQVCSNSLCEDCNGEIDGSNMATCEECSKSLCEDCNGEADAITYCHGCLSAWCDNCGDHALAQCTGSKVEEDGCFHSFCKPCVKVAKALVHCSGCRGTWCQGCMSQEGRDKHKCPHCAGRRAHVQNAAVQLGGLSISERR